MTTQGKLAYGIDEAADAIGITRSRAYRAIADGSLKSYKDGRRRMVSRRALEDYVSAKEKASQGRAAA